MAREISNSDDVIDSRDIIARIEELTATIDAAVEALAEAQGEPEEGRKPDAATCGTCGMSWDDGLASGVTPTPSGRCPFEHIHEEAAELKALTDLAEEADGTYTVREFTHGREVAAASGIPSREQGEARFDLALTWQPSTLTPERIQ